MIFLSLLAFAIDTIPELDSSWRFGLSMLELGCVIFFTLEYGVRIWTAPSKTRYLFSFMGVVDLLAVVPFWLGLTVELQSLRVFRIFRAFALFKMIRYQKAVSRLQQTIASIRDELCVFSLLAMMLLYFCGVGIFYFENPAQPENFSSVFDGLWWAVATLTTVGYGDVYPVTIGGKVFTFFILMIGLGIISIPAGLISSSLLKGN